MPPPDVEIEFRPAILDTQGRDSEAVLVYRDGRLAAVLTCLSEIHGDQQGLWFLEACFVEVRKPPPDNLFETLAEAEDWMKRSSPLRARSIT